MQRQIRQQEEQEKEVLEKIKMKMDRIKATHQGRPREHQDHFDGNKGNFFMLPWLFQVFLRTCQSAYR